VSDNTKWRIGTRFFDNDDTVWLDAKDRDRITMIPVTGAYDRRPEKLEFINFNSEWDPDEDWSGDGLNWTDELYRYGTDPYLKSDISVDTDGDGLTNQEEADVYGTDPLSPDTDGDGVCDETEVTGAVTRYVADHGEKGYKFYTSWEEITEDYGPPDKSFNYATNPLNPDTDFSDLNVTYKVNR